MRKITEQDLVFQLQKANSFAEGYKEGYTVAMNHMAQLLKAAKVEKEKKKD